MGRGGLACTAATEVRAGAPCSRARRRTGRGGGWMDAASVGAGPPIARTRGIRHTTAPSKCCARAAIADQRGGAAAGAARCGGRGPHRAGVHQLRRGREEHLPRLSRRVCREMMPQLFSQRFGRATALPCAHVAASPWAATAPAHGGGWRGDCVAGALLELSWVEDAVVAPARLCSTRFGPATPAAVSHSMQSC